MHRNFLKILVLLLPAVLIALSPLAYAANSSGEEEMQVLRMYYREDELVVTPTRSAKPVSQVAENITVITASEIEEMNAHTLTDVLNTVPGVEMDIRGGPGSAAGPHIQGSESRHVLVMIDGVTLNNLSDSFADISAIPVQDIERVEIIKGPASSSWGSSLGGVINIITKEGDRSRRAGGTLSASYGERNTGDYRAETSGKVDTVGYYLFLGNLRTNGMTPNTPFYENNLYTKIKWDATKKLSMLFTLGYNKGHRGEGQDQGYLFGNGFEYLFSTLSLRYRITDEAGLNLSVRTSRLRNDFRYTEIASGLFTAPNYRDKGDGGSLDFTWSHGSHSFVAGADYDRGNLKSNSITGGSQDLNKLAFFANDTITLGRFSVTPGVRHDRTNTNGSFTSPSLGVTYKLGEKTILRGYVERGFSIPPLSSTFGTGFFSIPNPDLKMEKVWSYQAGVESTALKYFWLKTTLFRHDISDAIDNEELNDGSFMAVNRGRQRRQGVEIEVKTVPLFNTSLLAGFAFIDARELEGAPLGFFDFSAGKKIPNIPRYTYDVGILYSNNKLLTASLRGHYIWWNAESVLDGSYNAFIWDLNLARQFSLADRRDIEIFFTAHNLFNASQYLQSPFKNPKRWVEAGLRVKL